MHPHHEARRIGQLGEEEEGEDDPQGHAGLRTQDPDQTDVGAVDRRVLVLSVRRR
jgi:hypothetical protein